MKRSNILGYLVGLLFGLIFSIPWVLAYSLFNLSIGYLSILIVIGVILGYKIIAKEIYNNGKTKLYLCLSSLLIVILDVVLIMPLLIILVKQGKITVDALNMIYSNKSMTIAFAVDLIMAACMVLIPSIFLPMDFKTEENKTIPREEFYNQIQELFEKHGALSQETAVDKKVIKSELDTISVGSVKKFFYTDLLKGIRIKSYKGKWYFKKSAKKFKYGLFFSVIALIAFAASWNISFSIFAPDFKDNIFSNVKDEIKEKTKNKEYQISDNITITMPDCMTFYEKDVDDSNSFKVFYYQYVSNNTNKSDLESIQIYYYENYNINDYVKNEEEYENRMHDLMAKYSIVDQKSLDLDSKYNFYYVYDKMSDQRISIGYYILYDNALIEVYTHMNKTNFDSDSELLSNNIIKSIKLTMTN